METRETRPDQSREYLEEAWISNDHCLCPVLYPVISKHYFISLILHNGPKIQVFLLLFYVCFGESQEVR